MVDLVGHAVEDGEVAANTQQLDVTTCGQQCSSEAQCVAYVYNRFTGDCSRYNTMPKPKAAACCTLFVKTCPGYSNVPSAYVGVYVPPPSLHPQSLLTIFWLVLFAAVS